MKEKHSLCTALILRKGRSIYRRITALLLMAVFLTLTVLTAGGIPAYAEEGEGDTATGVPIIASYSFDGTMADSISGYNGVKADSDTYGEGYNGHQALKVAERKSSVNESSYVGGAGAALLNGISSSYTLSAWINFDETSDGQNSLFRKGWYSSPFGVSYYNNGYPVNFWGEKADGGAYNGYFKTDTWGDVGVGDDAVGKWGYIAITAENGKPITLYVNGRAYKLENGNVLMEGIRNNNEAFDFGSFTGSISDFHIYAKALTPEEIAMDMNGTLNTRPATASDIGTEDTGDQGGGTTEPQNPVVAEAAMISGYEFNDSMADSINGYDGVKAGTDEYTEGRNAGDKALKINSNGGDAANTSYVGGEGAQLLNGITGKYTITAWINLDTSSSDNNLFRKRWGDVATPFEMQLYDNGNAVKFNAAKTEGGWYDTFVNDGSLSGKSGIWTHVALAFEAGKGLNWYINGQLQTSKSGEEFTSPVINNNNPINFQWFKGGIDSLHIYAEMLTANQVLADKEGYLPVRKATAADIEYVPGTGGTEEPETPASLPFTPVTPPGAEVPQVPVISSYSFEDNMVDSVNGYNGSKAGGDSYADSYVTEGISNKALKITGDNSSTLGGVNAALLNAVTDQYTISAKVKRDSVSRDDRLFSKRNSNWESEPFALKIFSGGAGQLDIQKSGGSWFNPFVCASVNSLKTTDWMHIAITYRANQGGAFYVNGAVTDTFTASQIDDNVKNNNNPLYLNGFRGLLDDVHIYPVALSAEQILWDRDNTLKTYPATAEDINKDPIPAPPAEEAAAPDPATVGKYFPEVAANTEEVPLIAHFGFEDNVTDTISGTEGKAAGVHRYAQGYLGKGLLMNGRAASEAEQTVLGTSGLLNRLSGNFSLSMWVYADKLSSDQTLLAKRNATWKSTPVHLYLWNNGGLNFNGYNGMDWYQLGTDGGAVTAKQWTNITFTYENGKKARWYVNGIQKGEYDLPYDLMPSDDSFELYDFSGTIDELNFYAKPLTSDEVKLAVDGRLLTRTAVMSDMPEVKKSVNLNLVRVDMPAGNVDQNAGKGRYYQNAVKKNGPDAIDWPEIELTIPQGDGSPLIIKPFEGSSSYLTQVVMQQDGKETPLFQQSYDNVIEPGNHWFRGLKWTLWGQSYIYTTDSTARSWMGDYELWTFPVIIKGSGEGQVRNVILSYNGKTIYDNTGTYNTLTLLLPASEKGKQYTLTVNGEVSQPFSVGWKEIEKGDPKYERLDVDLNLGNGITVENLLHPDTFGNQDKWDADTAAMTAGASDTVTGNDSRTGLLAHLGTEIDLSPETTYAVSLGAGMSGGFYFFNSPDLPQAAQYKNIAGASIDKYAEHLAGMNFDEVYEQTKGATGQTFLNTEMDQLAIALKQEGIKLGLVPDAEFNRPFLQHPNLSLFSYTLPDFHGPLYREIQLSAQRLLNYGNFAGVNVGADNSAYESYWSWAAPVPNRPFGEALTNLYNNDNPTVKISPTLSNTSYSKKDYEEYAGSVAEFLQDLEEYNKVFGQFSYFQDALKSIASGLTFISGSYGSSPGVGSRGGWSWGTIPVKEMYKDVDTMQAYDWNEESSSKPLHIVSLVDRMRSYYPDKTAWAIVDDFDLHFSKMDREAAYAMVLTRGVQGIGTNALPNDIGTLAKTDKVASISSLNDWIHTYGGTYAMTEPDASVGIMFVEEQSLTRSVNQKGDDELTEEETFNSPNEGKVNEAMVMLQAAGWPARVITPEEVKRGLTGNMKAILLVGLNELDGSWHWYDGIEDELKDFVQKGGRIITDSESAAPEGVNAIKTDIKIYSYTLQNNEDQTNRILNRNEENISLFRQAMNGAAAPLAVTGVKDAWAVPTTAGNTRYVTVVNAKHNGTETELTGQTVNLTWNAPENQVVYDVRQGKELEGLPSGADLTEYGFQYYALPAAKVAEPEVEVVKSEEKAGFYEAKVTINSNGTLLTGIPVEITVSGQGSTVKVYGATGRNIALPLADSDLSGNYMVTVKELLSGLTGSTEKEIISVNKSETSILVNREDSIADFSVRTQKLTIALTDEQYSDSGYQAQANRLKVYYEALGREVTIAKAEPNTDEIGIVTGVNPYMTPSMYPQWNTTDTDVILLGNDKNNVLIYDQARGCLVETGKEKPSLTYVSSAFAGEYDTLNIVANDLSGTTQAIDYLTTGITKPVPSAPEGSIDKIGETNITISWKSVKDADSYCVEIRESGKEDWTVSNGAVTGTSWDISGLKPATRYEIRIKAQGPTGDSSYSSIFEAATTQSGDTGTEQPGTEQPGTEQPGTEQPGTEQPGTEQPGTEQPGTEQPGTEQPGTEQPGTEQPGTQNNQAEIKPAPKLAEFTVDLKREVIKDSLSTPLGNFVTDLLLYGQKNVDFVFFSNDSIKSNLSANQLDEDAINNVLPDHNRLYKVKMTGAQIVKLLEQTVKNSSSPLQMAGLTARYDAARKENSRVYDLRLSNGTPVDLKKTYTILTSEYLAKGGGNYSVFRTDIVSRTSTNTFDNETLTAAVKALGAKGPLKADLKGRLLAGTLGAPDNAVKSTLYAGKKEQIVCSNLLGTAKVTYGSSNTKIAKVSSDGIITALKPGTITITTQIIQNNKTYLIKAKITVKKAK